MSRRDVLGRGVATETDLVDFVRQHIRSVWALELLLKLREDPARCWSPAELVQELRASQMLVGDNLGRLERSGLIVPEDQGCFRYAPASPILQKLCDDLEAAYRERPVSVINMIARPAGSLQSLADAFKIRGDGK